MAPSPHVQDLFAEFNKDCVKSNRGPNEGSPVPAAVRLVRQCDRKYDIVASNRKGKWDQTEHYLSFVYRLVQYEREKGGIWEASKSDELDTQCKIALKVLVR
jgi:hypothetical protein